MRLVTEAAARSLCAVVGLAGLAVASLLLAPAPAAARSTYGVLSLATPDDFPTAYVIDLDGTGYRLDAHAPRMSLSVPATADSRIVVRSLPSCAIVGSMDATGGSHYQLEFGPDGFRRIRERGGWDASLIMPPTTHACDSLPNTATVGPKSGSGPSEPLDRVSGSAEPFQAPVLVGIFLGLVSWFLSRRTLRRRSTGVGLR